MRDALLAYLLEDMEPDERARVEARLQSDPIWQHELERLRRCTIAYQADPESETCPPEDLVHRTCSFVQQAVRSTPAASKQGDHCPLPRHQSPTTPASLTESREPSTHRQTWSWSDITVTAGILLAVGMLLLPALGESREAVRRLTCQNNLRHLGFALVEYAQQRGGELPKIEPGENAGIFVLELADHGILTRDALSHFLVCPSTKLAADIFAGIDVLRLPTREELATAPEGMLEALRERMSGSYAYRIGYVNTHGEYHPAKFVGGSHAPLLADAPSFSVAGFQSDNHGGCGQNILYQDLSTHYIRQCVDGDSKDHLFLNADDQHAPGRHLQDVVLLRSEVILTGRGDR
ncbi:MAG: DUF1559 domain-containing protein [Pirellulales bacterium]|nr:DUF1559 domain-containing protein [Pirellulales bacterium]